MKVEINFMIYRTIGSKIYSYGPELKDSNFIEIANLAFELGLVKETPLDNSLSLHIVCEPGNENLIVLFEKLKSFGWTATRNHVEQGSREFFGLRSVRKYSSKDIRSADLLYMERFWNSCSGVRTPEGWLGYVDEMESWKSHMISFGLFTYFVSTPVKEKMLEENIKGVNFVKLAWDKPVKAKAEYWEIRSKITMPQSLNQVVNIGGNRLGYFEEGYSFPELSFERNEVELLGGFDVAFGVEVIGDSSRECMGKHVMIISQKFRKLLRTFNKTGPLLFMPVRLR